MIYSAEKRHWAALELLTQCLGLIYHKSLNGAKQNFLEKSAGRLTELLDMKETVRHILHLLYWATRQNIRSQSKVGALDGVTLAKQDRKKQVNPCGRPKIQGVLTP